MSTYRPLTDFDRKHWGPFPPLTEWLAENAGARVLEIGPGHNPFPAASHYVEFRSDAPALTNTYRLDLNSEPIPIADKSFDFVYCRHALEDMWNPMHAISEMERVAKAGYIETPSPVAELCRGVDGSSPPYRGYYHHRYVVWEHQGELRLIHKYPFVEYLQLDEGSLIEALRAGPKYWNTYFLWEGSINAQHRTHPLDFEILRDYAMMLADAAKQSMASADEFWTRFPTTQHVPAMARAYA
jgi:hypothetical protein